jgi:hypothetical protein
LLQLRDPVGYGFRLDTRTKLPVLVTESKWQYQLFRHIGKEITVWRRQSNAKFV